MRIQEHLLEVKVTLKPPKGKPLVSDKSITHTRKIIRIYKLTSITKGGLAVNKLGSTQKDHSKISGI